MNFRTSIALKTIACIFFVAMYSTFSVAQEKGPHGGNVVEKDGHKFEVTLSPATSEVNVYTLRSKKKQPLPGEMAITLFSDPQTSRTIELKTVEPLKASTQNLPQYQGALQPGAGSYIGFELRFRLGKKNTQSLRAKF